MPDPYEKRLLRVITYIHENPAGDLSLDTLADVAAMSRFHWHRIFAAMTGETLAEATRRIRMHRAACWLVQTDWPLAEVGAKVGYPNVQSFTRVFRENFGLTPGAFRARGALAAAAEPSPRGDTRMYPVDIIEVPERRLAALAHKGPYLEVGKTFEQVSAIFGRRNLWPHAQGMIGIYHDDPTHVPAADLRSHAGIVVPDGVALPDDLEDISIPAGKMAAMHYKGPYSGLRAAYDHLFGVWLPKSGQEPRDASMLEVYLNSPIDTAPEELLTDICMPLQ